MDYRGKIVNQHLDVVTESEEEYYCRCPFHSDNNSSFAVNKKNGLWICHGCNEKGNWNTLLRRLGIKKNYPHLQEIPVDAIDNIIRELDEYITDPTMDSDTEYFESKWLDQYKYPHEYWESRGLSEETVERFDLGYDPLTNSATIPLKTHHGKILGVIKRRLDPEANIRYLYPKGFNKAGFLYGQHEYQKDNLINENFKKLKYDGGVALVEGSIDALSFWEIGIPALAILGSNLSDFQKTLLNRLNPAYIVLCFDNDDAGKMAGVSVCDKMEIPIMVGRYKSDWAKDPADLTKEQRKELFTEAEMWFPEDE